MTERQAEEILARAEQLVFEMKDAGCDYIQVSLGCLSVEDCRVLAEASGAAHTSQPSAIGGRHIVIESYGLSVGEASIQWQGSRPMVAADLEAAP